MLKITMNEKEYLLQKKDNVQLKNEGTYGNGSIDWGARGLYLYEIAEQLNVKHPVAALVEGTISVLNTFITKDSKVMFLTSEDEEGQKILARTGEFLLCYGVYSTLAPSVQRVGHGIEDGLIVYADVILPIDAPMTGLPLEEIQCNVDSIVQRGNTITTKKLAYFPVVRTLREVNELYMLEQIERLDDGGPVTVHMLESYFDLYHGLLLSDFQMIQQIKLLYAENDMNKWRIYAKVDLKLE